MIAGRRAFLIALAVIAVTATACTDGDTVQATPSNDPIEARENRLLDECGTAESTGETDLADISDLSITEQQIIETSRGRSVPFLTAPNPVTCQPMTQTNSLVEPDQFGAFEALSFTNADPDLRFDVFYFTERPPHISIAGITDEIAAALSAELSAGYQLEVNRFAGSIFVATAQPGPASEDQQDMIDFYLAPIAGYE